MSKRILFQLNGFIIITTSPSFHHPPQGSCGGLLLLISLRLIVHRQPVQDRRGREARNKGRMLIVDDDDDNYDYDVGIRHRLRHGLKTPTADSPFRSQHSLGGEKKKKKQMNLR